VKSERRYSDPGPRVRAGLPPSMVPYPWEFPAGLLRGQLRRGPPLVPMDVADGGPAHPSGSGGGAAGVAGAGGGGGGGMAQAGQGDTVRSRSQGLGMQTTVRHVGGVLDRKLHDGHVSKVTRLLAHALRAACVRLLDLRAHVSACGVGGPAHVKAEPAACNLYACFCGRARAAARTAACAGCGARPDRGGLRRGGRWRCARLPRRWARTSPAA
jgi:hypothetical protein